MTVPLPAALAAYAAAGGPGAGEPYAVLADRDDGTVVRCGPAVAKAHAEDADREGLAVRVRIAGDRALAGVLLPPLRAGCGSVHGRPVSLWPYGTPVDPERPEDAPWEEAARLLAALHRTPLDGLPGPVPPMRGPAKVARALRRLARALPDTTGEVPEVPEVPEGVELVERVEGAATRADARAVRAAARTLPAWARGEAEAPAGGALCHGDLHLGQLVRHPAPAGPWLLIDVDDLGLGTPAWDLARPAAWYAAGLLDTGTWLRFLDAYRAVGGPAAGPPGSDPWPELDLAARALTVQTAALALAKAAGSGRRLDDVERLMVDACVRIAGLPADLESGPPS
ncbi:phosphotransferase family protein [Streptomyces sp. NPDC059989]|uniref:phosphotransferase family protein n=1 Tax=Streptomyces sp. NPDC059989 TaxID=3347026 RepID=UPI003684554C